MEYAVTGALPAGDISALRYAGRPDRRSAAFFIGAEQSG
jgi:hypothetical protein